MSEENHEVVNTPSDSQPESTERKRRGNRRKRRVSLEFKLEEEKQDPLNRFVIILVVTAFIFNTIYLGFCFVRLNLPSTKNGIIEKITESTGVEFEDFTKFNVGANNVKIQRVPFSFESAGIKGNLNGFRGDLDFIGYLKGELSGNTLRAQSGSFDVEWPLVKLDITEQSMEAFPLHYQTYLSEKANVTLMHDLKTIGTLSSSRLILRNKKAKLSGGRFTVFPFKGVEIDQLSWTLDTEGVALDVFKGNSSVGSGYFFLNEETKRLDFVNFGLSDFFSSSVAGLDFRIGTSLKDEGVEMRYVDAGMALDGEVDVESAFLGDLGFLRTFAAYFKNDNFKNLNLIAVESANIQASDNQITISNLHLVDTNLCTVKGWVSAKNNKNIDLSGELIVGVPMIYVCNEYGEPVVKGFGAAEGGFSEIRIKLSGNLKSPKDNVSQTVNGTWK